MSTRHNHKNSFLKIEIIHQTSFFDSSNLQKTLFSFFFIYLN